MIGALPFNPDGSKGVFLVGTSPHFWDWVEFFEVNGMPFRAALCRKQSEAGMHFVAQSPCDFDAGFVPRGQFRPKDNFIAPERRAALVAKVKASMPQVPNGARARYAQEDVRTERRPMPDARDLTEAEADSMRRLLQREECQ